MFSRIFKRPSRLVDQLRSSDPKRRGDAAYELGWVEVPGAVEALIAALRDEGDTGVGLGSVRARAAESLGRLRDRRAVSPLIDMLRTSDRRAAAEALGNIGDPSAVGPLRAFRAALGGSPLERDASDAARIALTKLGDTSVIGELADTFISFCNDFNTATEANAAAEALSGLGPAAFGALVKGLHHSDAGRRGSVVRLLASMGWQPHDAAERALNAVAQLDWPAATRCGDAAVEALVMALKSGFPRGSAHKKEALLALARIETPAAQEAIMRLLDWDPSLSLWLATELHDHRRAGSLLRASALRSVAAEAIGALESLLSRSATDVALDELHAIVDLGVVIQERPPFWDSYNERYVEGQDPVNLTRVKALARLELERRRMP